MNASIDRSSHKAPSWLALIAETAGVAASQVARIELTGSGHGPTSVIVQILAHDGRLLGAERWEGRAEDLALGAWIDVGVWMTEDDAHDARVIAFIDEGDRRIDPALLRAPVGQTGRRVVLSRASRVDVRVPQTTRARAA